MKRRHHPQVYGVMFRPSSSSIEEHVETIYSAAESIKEGFRKKYEYNMGSMYVIACCAKIYILQNFDKITDWSDLELSVMDNTGEETYYYKHIDRKHLWGPSVSEKTKQRWEERDKESKDSENIVREVSDV